MPLTGIPTRRGWASFCFGGIAFTFCKQTAFLEKKKE
jgi:hypothetical protein